MSKYVKFYFSWGKRNGILLFDGQLGLQSPKQFEILEIQISRQKFLYSSGAKRRIISHFAASFIKGTLAKKDEAPGEDEIKRRYNGSLATLYFIRSSELISWPRRLCKYKSGSRRDAAGLQLYHLHSLHSQERKNKEGREILYILDFCCSRPSISRVESGSG